MFTFECSEKEYGSSQWRIYGACRWSWFEMLISLNVEMILVIFDTFEYFQNEYKI